MICERRRRTVRALRLLDDAGDGAPELSLLNLVDLMLVFAVGLMLAIVSYYGLRDLLLDRQAVTVVKSENGQVKEIIVKKPHKVERMRITRQSLDGEGVRVGTAYLLNSGEIVYVPEDDNGR